MAKKKNGSELENLTFEQAIEALSEIVEKIETGQVPLQESLEQYEKGMALIARCRGILQEAEKRIEKIESGRQGGPEETEKEVQDKEGEEKEEGLF